MRPSTSPIDEASIINTAVCISNAGGSFDGTYRANGTMNDRQIFIKPYLPQLNRSFVYLFYRNNDSWIIYRDTHNDQFWFLECPISSYDVTECDTKWTTSWSGNEALISIQSGECEAEDDEIPADPTKKPTLQPITSDQVNTNFMCVRGTTRSNLDGTYLYNGTYKDHDVFIKEYEPQQNKPWVYIKWEPQYDHWGDDAVYGWIIYRKFESSNYYVYCDTIWAEAYYENVDNLIYDDPTKCNGHWITNWYNDADVEISLNYGMCAEDVIVAETQNPTMSPNISPPETEQHCGSVALVNDTKPSEYYFDEICLDHIVDESLAGIYKLNGSYNGYPAYVKPYLPDEDKPFVFIKYEDVIIGDIDDDGVVDTRRQWIIYREYCAQTYYLYCEHTQNSSDINQCSGYWHASWSGKEANITSSDDTSHCLSKLSTPASVDDLPSVVCMSNTGTDSLDGRYEVSGTRNGRSYYKKDYVSDNSNNESESIYIKYEQKWMIFSDLEDEHTYFLECDASISAFDVTLCDKKWKGDPKENLIDVRSVDCSQSTEINEWSKITNNSKQHHKIRATVLSIIGFFGFVCLICFGLIQKRKYDERNHKFNRLSDVDNDSDNDDDDLSIDHINPLQDIDDVDEIAVTYTVESGVKLDHENGIGGGTKTNGLFGRQKVSRIRSAESAELVSSHSEEEDDVDEFTSDLLSDNDDHNEVLEDEEEPSTWRLID